MFANIYAHYFFDLWAHQWRRRYARGDVVILRFADGAVVAFEHREDAERFRDLSRERAPAVPERPAPSNADQNPQTHRHDVATAPLRNATSGHPSAPEDAALRRCTAPTWTRIWPRAVECRAGRTTGRRPTPPWLIGRRFPRTSARRTASPSSERSRACWPELCTPSCVLHERATNRRHNGGDRCHRAPGAG
jgi:hypothetical protein